jgi:hypothetical protein
MMSGSPCILSGKFAYVFVYKRKIWLSPKEVTKEDEEGTGT